MQLKISRVLKAMLDGLNQASFSCPKNPKQNSWLKIWIKSGVKKSKLQTPIKPLFSPLISPGLLLLPARWIVQLDEEGEIKYSTAPWSLMDKSEAAISAIPLSHPLFPGLSQRYFFPTLQIVPLVLHRLYKKKNLPTQSREWRAHWRQCLWKFPENIPKLEKLNSCPKTVTLRVAHGETSLEYEILGTNGEKLWEGQEVPKGKDLGLKLSLETFLTSRNLKRTEKILGNLKKMVWMQLISLFLPL